MFSRSQLASVPLLPLTLCFAAGIVLYSCGCSVWVEAGIFALAVFLFFVNRYFCILALGVCTGFASACVSFDNEPDLALSDKLFFYKARIDDVSESVSSQRLNVALLEAGDSLEMVPVRITKASLIVPGFSPEFSKGQILVFKAILTPNTALRDLPDEIDPADFLIRKHIYLGALITTDDILSIQGPEGLTKGMLAIHNRVIAIISQSELSPEAKEFVIATLFGNTKSIDERTREDFQTAGIAHVLAVSGLHVGIIAFMVSLLLWPLFLAGHGRLRWIFVALAVWGYVFITGFSPSATRAAIMASVFVIGWLLKRNIQPVNSLCLAALIILVFEPIALFEIGFQLSFAAVLAILIFAGRINPVSPRRKLLHAIAAYVAVSLCAMLGTGVLSAIYFHSFPLYFLLSNIAVCMVLPFIVGGGLLILIAGFAGLSCGLVCYFVSGLCTAVVKVTGFISSLPGSAIDGIYFQSWILLPMVLVLIMLKNALDNKSKLSFALLSVATLIFIACAGMSAKIPSEPVLYLTRDKQHTEIVFIDSAGILNLVSNQPNEPLNIKERAQFRFSDFMLRRDIDSIKVDTFHRQSDRMVIVGSTTLGLISGKKQPLPDGKLSYAILSKGFRGEIDSVMARYSPDTIIIAYDLHPRRAGRYVLDCRRAGYPYIWCREKSWSLSYDSSLYPRVK